MAHMIEIRNGVASYAENAKVERAWHGLGKPFDRPMFVKEALQACSADYTVKSQPVFFMTDELQKAMAESDTIPTDLILKSLIPKVKANVRTDLNKSLGLVSDKYGIVQNEEAFKFIDLFCSGELDDRKDNPVIECCGVLGQGERVFITAKFSTPIVLDAKRDDIIEKYVVFTTSHDGTGAVQMMVTPVRVVCNNTLNLAMKRNDGRYSFKHTKNVSRNMDLLNTPVVNDIHKALKTCDVYEAALKERFEHLKNIKVSEKELDNILASITLSPDAYDVFKQTGNIEHDDIKSRGRNLFNSMKEAVHTGIGQDILENGNGLWLINGITTFYQNNQKYKDDEVKLDAITKGRVYESLNKAQAQVLQLAV